MNFYSAFYKVPEIHIWIHPRIYLFLFYFSKRQTSIILTSIILSLSNYALPHNIPHINYLFDLGRRRRMQFNVIVFVFISVQLIDSNYLVSSVGVVLRCCGKQTYILEIFSVTTWRAKYIDERGFRVFSQYLCKYSLREFCAFFYWAANRFIIAFANMRIWFLILTKHAESFDPLNNSDELNESF